MIVLQHGFMMEPENTVLFSVPWSLPRVQYLGPPGARRWTVQGGAPRAQLEENGWSWIKAPGEMAVVFDPSKRRLKCLKLRVLIHSQAASRAASGCNARNHRYLGGARYTVHTRLPLKVHVFFLEDAVFSCGASMPSKPRVLLAIAQIHGLWRLTSSRRSPVSGLQYCSRSHFEEYVRWKVPGAKHAQRQLFVRNRTGWVLSLNKPSHLETCRLMPTRSLFKQSHVLPRVK